jgi:cytochrome P450
MAPDMSAIQQPSPAAAAGSGGEPYAPSQPTFAMRMLFALLERPWLLRVVFAVLRRVRPVLVLRGTTVITRNADIKVALTSDADITMTTNGPPPILDAPFVLHMDKSPRYDHEIGILRRVVLRSDLPRVAALARDEAERQVAQAKGQIDVVAHLAVPVGLRVIADYFGVPPPEPADLMVNWLRRLGVYIITASFDDPGEKTRAEAAAAGYRHHMAGVVAARHQEFLSGKSLDDTVLSRLVRMIGTDGVDEDFVRRNLGGCFIGLFQPVLNATALATHQLLSRPERLAGARTAASADDLATMEHYAVEALRFSPVFPMLRRGAPYPTAFVGSDGRSHAIPGGASVVVAALSGMFDAAAFPRPGQFDPSRPLEDYMIFGHGTHRCLGEHIARTEIPAMLGALLKRRELRPAPGALGKPHYDGPAITRLLLDFQA